ncbi:MAG: methylated-DNA--[protein]-cysteine S-methyltransferase [Vampirovibrionales bacterium]
MRQLTETLTSVLAKASPFEKQVWEALLTIPKGETRTYQQIAESIGKPKAYRAVANAIGRNPYYPDIPCHRVIRKDGTLGGYSGEGGLARKQELLHQEGVTLKTRSRKSVTH